MKRAERRKEEARLFKKRYQQEIMYRSMTLNDQDKEHNHKCAVWRVNRRLNANTLCSCAMCASPRYLYGNSVQARTRQELRSDISMREQLEE